jgi:hypothetical protein
MTKHLSAWRCLPRSLPTFGLMRCGMESMLLVAAAPSWKASKAMHLTLTKFPKLRPELPPRHRAVYEREYALNRSGSGPLYAAVAALERWMHSSIARREPDGPVLELGAGNLNHLKFESDVSTYDVCEPLAGLLLKPPLPPSVRYVITDYRELRGLPGEYSKVLSIAVLEHLEHLPYVVAQSALLLAPDGVFQAGVPSEGGALWGLSWRLSTGLAYRLRTGLDYASLMQHEHVNTVDEIEAIVEYFFQNVCVSRFPFAAKHLSFYSYVEASNPRRGLCTDFLETYIAKLGWER